MATYLGSQALFLAVAIATHALVGYALGTAIFDAPRAGRIGAVVADVDLLVPATWGPLVHRGLTHSALGLGIAVALVTAHSQQAAGGVGLGYLSRFAIDATTTRGIPLGAPFWPTHVSVPLGGHSPEGTASLWVGSLALLFVSRAGSTDSLLRAGLPDWWG